MSKLEQQIRLKLSGPSVDDGKVAVSLLAAKLEALQKSLYNVAAATTKRLSVRGAWDNEIREQCELFLLEVNPGSLEVVAEVPSDPQAKMPPGVDIGVQGIRNLLCLADAVSSCRTEGVTDIIPDYGARLRTLKTIESLCPEPDAEYEVSLTGTNGNGQTYYLKPSTRKYIRETFWEKFLKDEETEGAVSGQLVMIRVQGRDQISVISNRREISCYYSPELEGVVSQLIAGSIVEVTGDVILDSNGEIQEIRTMHSVDTVSLMPFHLKEFKWEDRRFVLNSPVSCKPDFKNGLWVYECERFGLHAYAETREQACMDFHEEFAVIWDCIALEDDDKLAADAKRLKTILTNSVDKVEQV